MTAIHQARSLRLAFSMSSFKPKTTILFDVCHFEDRMAARLLKSANPLVKSLALTFGGHPCTGYIREAQVFGALQDILLETDFAATDIFQLKKSTWVRSPSYRFILTEYLNIRKSRPGSPQFAPDS